MKMFTPLFGLLFACGLIPQAAQAGSPMAPMSAADSFHVGNLSVRRSGDHGRALILIPGLGSGAWVWKDTVVGAIFLTI